MNKSFFKQKKFFNSCIIGDQNQTLLKKVTSRSWNSFKSIRQSPQPCPSVCERGPPTQSDLTISCDSGVRAWPGRLTRSTRGPAPSHEAEHPTVLHTHGLWTCHSSNLLHPRSLNQLPRPHVLSPPQPSLPQEGLVVLSTEPPQHLLPLQASHPLWASLPPPPLTRGRGGGMCSWSEGGAGLC